MKKMQLDVEVSPPANDLDLQFAGFLSRQTDGGQAATHIFARTKLLQISRSLKFVRK